MRTRKVCLALIVTLVSTVTFAQWNNNGNVVPNKPWVKSSGALGAILAFTDKPDELFAAWGRPGAAVHVSETSKAVRGVPIVAIIFFTGCAPDAQGKQL